MIMDHFIGLQKTSHQNIQFLGKIKFLIELVSQVLHDVIYSTI